MVTPWARALSGVYCDELIRLGHEVRLVTTTRHHERRAPRSYELVVPGPFRQPSSWTGVARVIAAARRFAPDVVVAEEFADPRLLPLLSLAPLATLVHDDTPHDATHHRPLHQRMVIRRVVRAAQVLVTYSDYVAAELRSRGATRVATVPLPSEVGEQQVPPFVPAAQRRDVVLIGRIWPYKNLEGTFDAWTRHVGSRGYRGDRLLVIGEGEYDGPIPEHCEWRRAHFQFAEVLPVLASAKASLAYYVTASQSGVQVLSMQCGTSALVSASGGLAEYLPPGEQPIPLGEPRLLAAALDQLADPVEAERRGAAARAQFESRYHESVAVPALCDVLERLCAGEYATVGRR